MKITPQTNQQSFSSEISQGNQKKPLAEFTKGDLSPYFVMEIAEASAILGVPVEALNQHCRSIGIRRWPYNFRLMSRKLKDGKTPKIPSPFGQFRLETIKKPPTNLLVIQERAIERIIHQEGRENEKLPSFQKVMGRIQQQIIKDESNPLNRREST